MYLLELPHVEQLDGPLRLQLAALGKLQNLAGDRGVLAGGGRLKVTCKVKNCVSYLFLRRIAHLSRGDLCALDEHVCLGDPLDEDVAGVVHLDLAALEIFLRIFPYVSHTIILSSFISPVRSAS